MAAKGPETQTQDGRLDGWSQPEHASQVALRPRLRVLYHADLRRIGAVSLPGAIPEDEGWLTLGRYEPELARSGESPRPIDDLQVSRAQARLQWLPDVARFAVEPAPEARRPPGRLDPGKGAPVAITGNTLLPPGSCIALGDRVLLGLELGRAYLPDADRMGLVGESEVMWALRDEIASVAKFGRPALIFGPTGAGKELVARALHSHGPRPGGPFVPVNCAALPEQLVESVLFGHKKGAFTGAESDEKGLFRAADGGTIFLDEVGELPLSVQPKLLRVLQEGVVVPVGGADGKKVEVRVVAATHRDLAAHVASGKVREDLYHRLAGHVVHVPSLAERRFDVPELFVHALEKLRVDHAALEWLFAESGSVPIAFFAELIGREWTGNVRELGNLAERTARLNLVAGQFRAPPWGAAAPSPPAAPEPVASAPVRAAGAPANEEMVRAAAVALGLAHKTVNKLLSPQALSALAEDATLGEDARTQRIRTSAVEALVSLLDAHDYNQSEVAQALGTSRTTLIKLMADLGVPRAADLSDEHIARAQAQAGGDLEAAARLLRVSANALRRRLSQRSR